jgi:hypothetical protein
MTIKMRSIPYTDKYPFMYQVELTDYILETTNESAFINLVKSLKVNCLDDMYSNLPESMKIKIAMASIAIKAKG